MRAEGTFLCDLIDIRRRMAEFLATTIGPAIVPAGVIGHEDDDVGFFVVRRWAAMRPVLRRGKALQLLATPFPHSS
jgi:hypothetical protein